MGKLDQIRLLLKQFSTEEFQNAFGDFVDCLGKASDKCKYLGCNKEYTELADVERDIKALMTLSEDKMPPHLARFVKTAKLAIQFAHSAVAAETHEDCKYGSCEERVMNDFRQLQTAVFADDQVDDLEKAVLFYTLHRLGWEEGSPINASGMLRFLLDGNRLPGKLDGPTPVPNSSEKAYLNTGLKNEPEMCQWAEGFTQLSWDDPRVKERNLRDTCYMFALSGTPSWKIPAEKKNSPVDEHMSLGDYYFDYLRENFRTVDLEREAARPGDIIAYYDSYDTNPDYIQFNIKHMAAVTEVDENGYPIRAISKLGFSKVVEHPVDQVSLSYGFLWVVKRDKSLDLITPPPTR